MALGRFETIIRYVVCLDHFNSFLSDILDESYLLVPRNVVVHRIQILILFLGSVLMKNIRVHGVYKSPCITEQG